MYNQPKEDTEAYLLGKGVSDLEQIQKLGRDYEESTAQRLARIDMEAKLREDPLTVMKQREAEKRMELLQNTAKVKKLRRLLAMQKQQKESHKKRRRTKKLKRRGSAEGSSSDSSSGDELLEKFIKIIKQSDEKETEAHEKRRKSSAQDNTPKHKGNIHPSTSHSSRSVPQPERPKLSREELEARRVQMLRDAEEHEKVRSIRTSEYRSKRMLEEHWEKRDRERHGASFISELKNDHAQRSSIEDGVHRKAGRRQPTESSSNFLKR